MSEADAGPCAGVGIEHVFPQRRDDFSLPHHARHAGDCLHSCVPPHLA